MARLDVRDRLLVVKKPFDVVEVSQLARTLTAKWDLARQAESQIEGLARAVEEIKAGEAALRQSHKELETFAHTLSHDLRGPLTALGSFTQLLARELEGAAAGKALHYLTRIQANAAMAGQQIDDLLFLDGVSRAALNPEPVELGALVRELIDMLWMPRLDAHRPEMIFISAGFDAHREDDMAQMGLVENDYAWMTQRIMEVAKRHAKGRIVSCLEGGYSLSALARSVEAHLRVLAGV